ncbi:hypothetical protein [Desulfovibrio falkowii]|uniref:Uncharacterized protein n=1 Tax=Desulfovibrio falkowii TaxID=3136602 RepID=A0ABQ0EA60_9BACT
MALRKITRTRRSRLVYVPQSVTHSYSAQQIQAASFDDVFSLVLQSIRGEDFSSSPLFDGRFNFSIRISGERWSGDIDYRIALFLLRTQNQIISIYNKYSEKKIRINSLHNNYDGLILRLRVEDGSTKIFFYIERCLKHLSEMAKGMDSKDKKDCIVALASIAGLSVCIGLGSWLHFSTQADIAKHQIQANVEIAKIDAQKNAKIEDEETKRLLAEVARESVKHTGSLVASVEYLAKQMGQKDEMHVGGRSYTRPEAVAAFKQSPNVEDGVIERSFIIDGGYDITDVGLEDGNIMIKIDGKKRKVITRLLPEQQKDYLHKLYRDSEIVNTYPRNVPLQITVIIKDGKWQEGHVFGIGPARKGAVSITKALEMSVPREKSKQKQASLLE